MRAHVLVALAAARAKPRPVIVTSVPPVVGPPPVETLYEAVAYMR
jgi:hypothetical protein